MTSEEEEAPALYRVVSEHHRRWVSAAEATGNGKQPKKFALPAAAHAFNTWAGKTKNELK